MINFNSLIILDTETSSFNIDQAEIIELACGFLDGNEFTIETEQYQSHSAITAEAKSISWITERDLAGKKHFLEDFGSEMDLAAKISLHNSEFVAHNASYDRTVLVNAFNRANLEVPNVIKNNNNWICTLKLARKIFMNNPLPQYTLGFLWFHFGLDKDAESLQREIIPHRADSDIFMTYKVLKHLVELLVQSGDISLERDIVSQLIEYQNEPVYLTAFPFGKHKGADPKSIPTEYYEWLLNNSESLDEESRNYDPNLVYTVSVVLSERL